MKSRMRYRWLGLLVATTTLVGGVAPVASSLSLEDAIQAALTTDETVSQARQQVRQAEAQLGQARAEFFHSLDATTSYSRIKNAPTFEIPGVGEGDDENMALELSLTQPLYTSGLLSGGRKMAELGVDIAEAELARQMQTTTFEVTKAYYSVLLAQASLEVTEESLELARRHRDQVQARYDSGSASRFDLMRAEVELANWKPTLLSGKNDYRLAREGLATLINQPVSDVYPEGKLAYQPLTMSLQEALSGAYRQRLDLVAAHLGRRISELQVKMSQAEAGPHLVFQAGYSWAKAPSDPEWSDDWNFALILSYPLAEIWKSRDDIKVSKAVLEQSRLGQSQLREAVELEVKQALWSLDTAAEAIAAAEKNVDQAREVMELAEIRYHNGSITNLEYLDAQLALSRAKTAYVKALYDHNLSRVELEYALGEYYQEKGVNE